MQYVKILYFFCVKILYFQNTVSLNNTVTRCNISKHTTPIRVLIILVYASVLFTTSVCVLILLNNTVTTHTHTHTHTHTIVTTHTHTHTHTHTTHIHTHTHTPAHAHRHTHTILYALRNRLREGYTASETHRANSYCHAFQQICTKRHAPPPDNLSFLFFMPLLIRARY